ncbi:RluA family pseudouridine synthase [Lapidilactobacillus luobeiensis]|uniref:RluA family pseudouridine synthase n=1 Tax=Lapidilactobacillus luobeiensis TaxID=2950371 RepID=UPI0021C40867|nr:RluA family pseudouridine synthase [Lapidilactobacillus luobeiensis]
MKTQHFKITTESGRLDRVMTQLDPTLSRSQIQSAIKAERLLVNGQPTRAKYAVHSGDELTLIFVEPLPITAKPQAMPLDIIYEDDQVLVVNKPQGLVVHPSPGHPDGTLVNGLLAHGQLSSINGQIRPGIVHRIDKDTSGLLMVAKTDIAHQSLAAQLKAKTNLRRYLALVHGVISADTGTIDAPIARDPKNRQRQAVVAGGRHAVTHFKVLERFDQYTLVECQLETGRTHQIRVHFRYIGHPLAGDPLYGPKKTLSGHGQFLHAATLGFKHPTTGQWLTFEAPLPAIFTETLTRLRQERDRHTSETTADQR